MFSWLRRSSSTLEEELITRGIWIISLSKVRGFQWFWYEMKVRLGEIDSDSEWEIFWLKEYERYFGSLPPDVQEIVDKARDIRRAEIRVEKFDKSLFVFVERRRRGHYEEYCIAFSNCLLLERQLAECS